LKPPTSQFIRLAIQIIRLSFWFIFKNVKKFQYFNHPPNKFFVGGKNQLKKQFIFLYDFKMLFLGSQELKRTWTICQPGKRIFLYIFKKDHLSITEFHQRFCPMEMSWMLTTLVLQIQFTDKGGKCLLILHSTTNSE